MQSLYAREHMCDIMEHYMKVGYFYPVNERKGWIYPRNPMRMQSYEGMDNKCWVCIKFLDVIKYIVYMSSV